MIVLCSPAAKTSHWVNEEIRLFRQLHGEASILCALIEGNPQTAFPPALTEGGREPLAANLTRQNFKLGTLQIAASMLGVGLDSLVQRDNQRRRRRSQAITAGALLFSATMGTTALIAVDARNQAETNRSQAEDLVEYMITDLKDKLEPVGRLDLLDGIGDRAVEYYDAQDIQNLPDESLSRQARARHILGQVALDQNDNDKARREINAAAKLTQDVLNRNPGDTDAIFAHAQSEYWQGEIYNYLDDVKTVQKHWTEYNRLARKLHEADPTNITWLLEMGYSENGLGKLNFELLNFTQALIHYEAALRYYNEILATVPTHRKTLRAAANVYSGFARTHKQIGDSNQSNIYRARQIKIYDEIIALEPDDQYIIYKRALATARILTSGNFDKDSDEYQELLLETTTSFEKLIADDPTNQRWQKVYDGFQQAIKK